MSMNGVHPLLHTGADFPAGSVALIGCGPGALDLLTLRALRFIEQADVLVYDYLVGPDILERAPAQAERLYVGKKASNHSLPQEDINALLVRLAKDGKRVARLKGGDPFIFGRGGEEMDHLHAEGVVVTIIPGITAAAGCAAAAGIPLTHRDHAQRLVLATGHLQPGEKSSLEWPALAHPGQTLVFYMGISNAAEISRQLIAHGLPGTTPVAIVERGTTPRQRIVRCRLAQLQATLVEQDILPPALLLIGGVAG